MLNDAVVTVCAFFRTTYGAAKLKFENSIIELYNYDIALVLFSIICLGTFIKNKGIEAIKKTDNEESRSRHYVYTAMI